MISVQNRTLPVRASVVQGDVPLLHSKKVLSGLGMLYDHPASVVRPQGIAGCRFPTPEEWAGDELHIIPQSGNQFMLHMTCASQVVPDADSTPRQLFLLLAARYSIFYPKRSMRSSGLSVSDKAFEGCLD